MALADFLKGKKKTPAPPGPAPAGAPGALAPGLQRGLTAGKESPAQMVVRMKGQGMTQQQVIEALNREGYSQTQIYDALDTASKMEGQAGPAGGPGAAATPGPAGAAPGGPPPMGPAAVPGGPSLMGGPGMTPAGALPSVVGAPHYEQVDELIEKTVQEKWHDFTSELKKMEEFKGSVETRVAKLETQLTSLDNKLDNLKNALIAKIKDYDTSILNVGTEMKAMEQVFQKILPELQQNVSELSRVTSRIKKPASKK